MRLPLPILREKQLCPSSSEGHPTPCRKGGYWWWRLLARAAAAFGHICWYTAHICVREEKLHLGGFFFVAVYFLKDFLKRDVKWHKLCVVSPKSCNFTWKENRHAGATPPSPPCHRWMGLYWCHSSAFNWILPWLALYGNHFFSFRQQSYIYKSTNSCIADYTSNSNIGWS